MLGNMLNDLAEAIRRWTEKKMSMQTTELPKHWKASWVTSRGPTDQVSAQLALHWRLYHGPSCGTVQMQVSQQIFFTHKLEPVTSLLCGCVVVCFFCGLFLLVFVFLCCFLLLVLCVSVFVLWKRDKGIGLCIGPLPVPYSSAPA